LGRWGETQAAHFLEERGYLILERNARTPYGEIDLVAQRLEEEAGYEGATLVTVFVEVKTRTTTTFGLPEEAITARKREHLIAAAQSYLQNHPELGGDWRIDVIAIQRYRAAAPPAIYHFENAVN
jgi:putative endonuclease